MDRTDEQLLVEARTGDHEAFHHLVDRYAGLLYGLAFRLLGREADAEDAVQETFLAAFRGIHSFKGRSTVRTWLYGILLRRVARIQREQHAHAAEPLADRTGTAGGADGNARTRLDVQEALMKLAPDHRQVLVLREFAGLSYREIAQTLGVPMGTVESRLHRARQQMQDLLKGYFE